MGLNQGHATAWTAEKQRLWLEVKCSHNLRQGGVQEAVKLTYHGPHNADDCKVCGSLLPVNSTRLQQPPSTTNIQQPPGAAALCSEPCAGSVGLCGSTEAFACPRSLFAATAVVAQCLRCALLPPPL